MAVKGAIQRMAKKKIRGTRILATVLMVAMVFTSTPYTALAAESEAGYVTVQNETEQTGQADDGNNGETGENGDVSGSDETGDIPGNSGDNRDKKCDDIVSHTTGPPSCWRSGMLYIMIHSLAIFYQELCFPAHF